jgi:transcriptional regulator with XRE-family HTH domain
MIETKIQILRMSLGYTQKFMADKLGIRQEAYSRIESGQHKLKLSDPLLSNIAVVLRVPEADLLDSHPILICTGNFLVNGHQLEQKDEEIANLKQQLAQKEAQIEKLLEILRAAGGGG